MTPTHAGLLADQNEIHVGGRVLEAGHYAGCDRKRYGEHLVSNRMRRETKPNGNADDRAEKRVRHRRLMQMQLHFRDGDSSSGFTYCSTVAVLRAATICDYHFY